MFQSFASFLLFFGWPPPLRQGFGLCVAQVGGRPLSAIYDLRSHTLLNDEQPALERPKTTNTRCGMHFGGQASGNCVDDFGASWGRRRSVDWPNYGRARASKPLRGPAYTGDFRDMLEFCGEIFGEIVVNLFAECCSNSTMIACQL